MVGNDIIDLSEARLSSNWERPGFLKKVFSSEEQHVIRTSANPFQTVWRMWSMKESAYKFYLQKDPHALRGFYPAKIKCQLLSSQMGRVSIQGIKLNTKTIKDPYYLFSTAFSALNVQLETEIFYLSEKNYEFQSTFAREKLLDFFVQKKQMEKTHLILKKSKSGASQIFYKSQLLPFICSLTHHGNYGGFSISSI